MSLIDKALDWAAGRFDRLDIVDAYMVVSELKEFCQTPAEKNQLDFYDGMAGETAAHGSDSDIPLGKQVW